MAQRALLEQKEGGREGKKGRKEGTGHDQAEWDLALTILGKSLFGKIRQSKGKKGKEKGKDAER